MKKLSGSLSVKVSVLAFAFILLTAMAIGIFGYTIYREDAIDMNASRARSIAETVASSIDPVQFKAIMETKDKNEYWYFVKNYVDRVKANNDLFYLYVLDKNYSASYVTYFVEGNKATDKIQLGLGELQPTEAYASEMYETIRTGISTATGVYQPEGFDIMVSGFSPILDENNTVIGVVGVDLQLEDVIAASNSFGRTTLIIMLVSCVLFSVSFMLYANRFIGKPVGLMAKALDQMGTKGDLQLTPEMMKSATECSTWKDEIGICARAVGGLIGHLMDLEKDLAHVADGDLTVTVTTLSDRDNIGLSVSKLVDNLNSMFGEINASTAQVSSGSTQIADGAQALAQGSTEQASAVEELSSSISEIAAKTKANAEMANKAANLASIIMGNAEKGSRQMDEMISAVKEINRASQGISKIIKVIDDIAFQTNILALNAAVEAAQAGQHGKGFSVVAEEVRNLAAKSAEAAKDTESLIADSMEKAELGARIADDTAASLAGIVSGIDESNQLVSEIAKSSEEQSESISQINNGIDQVAQVVQQNSATAEESAAASEEMSGQAAMLESLISQFKLSDGGADRFQTLQRGEKRAHTRLPMTDKKGLVTASGKY